MPATSRLEGETLAQLATRLYATRRLDGSVDPVRVERLEEAIRVANPDLAPGDPVELPDVDGIPRLQHVIDDPGELHDIVHRLLEEVRHDRRLLILSFIDPIRLGRDEYGIEGTPEVIEEVRARLAGAISFDQEAYQRALDGDDPFEGRSLSWQAAGG